MIPSLVRNNARKDFKERGQMIFDIELPGYIYCSASQARMSRGIAQTGNDGLRQTARCRRVARSEMTVHAIDQPVRYTADRESGNRHAEQSGLRADQTERLRPQARHDQQVA